MPLSKELIDQALGRIRNTDKSYMVAQPFSNFMPLQYSTNPVGDESSNTQLLQSIGQNATARGDVVSAGLSNKFQKQALQGANKHVRELQRQLNAPGAHGEFEVKTNQQPRTSKGTESEKGRWGTTPEVSDIRKLHPNAPIKTVNWRGHEFQVNSQVAPIFVAFLNDLAKQGYKPAVIQGYNDRNIAGTNTPSLHSYGFAIDIDPAKNPVQDAGQHMQTSLPPKIATLASKYGLAWGGSWHSYKDPMHFSVPFHGTE